MPFSDPEPAARPLLVGALMPPAFDEMILRVTMLTSPGSAVLGWSFANLSRSTWSRNAARSSMLASSPLFDALTRASTGGVGLAATGAFSTGFSGLRGGGGGG